MESYVRIGGRGLKNYVCLHGGRGVKNGQNKPYVINEWSLNHIVSRINLIPLINTVAPKYVPLSAMYVAICKIS